ncbi:hypothetical protein [Candidatus Saccharimonas aalborgensis]|nr:hypothetical protein [Candidatus Saccharimonas aalborgensis]
MNENARFWLDVVATKLYRDIHSGMDFEHNEHRWIFDWDDSLNTDENLANVAAEDKALMALKQVGAIKSGSKPNYFRDQQLEAMENLGRGAWGDKWDKTDQAHREYDYIRFIDDVDYDKFIGFCEEHGINYKGDGIPATLEIVNQTPIVRAKGKTYTLKTLSTGSTLDIIELIYAKRHFNEPTTFDDLRRWLNKPDAFSERKQLTQIYRNDSPFHSGNVLSPFADITAKTFTLKNRPQLTLKQLATIQENSIK